MVGGTKVRHIPADRSVRERLSRGEIAMVRRNGGYELVPAETADRIRERDEHAVIQCGGARLSHGTRLATSATAKLNANPATVRSNMRES